VINYRKSLDLAKRLNLDAQHARTFASLLHTVTPSQVQKPFLNFGLGLGLKLLQSTADTHRLKEYIESDPRHSIRLLFPNLDFNYNYVADDHLIKLFDEPYQPIGLKQMCLLPHIKLQSKASTLR